MRVCQEHYFYSFLIAEVSAEALDSYIDFCRSVQWVPIEGNGVVSDLFDRPNNSGRVLGVGVEYALLNTVLSAVPELPGLYLFVVKLLFTKYEHDK